MNDDIFGLLIVDKEKGMTSHDVVSFVRRRFKIKKVGHAGTLDPMATGVIVLLLGKATKLSNTFLSQDKEYEAVMKLGEKTDTGDSEGVVSEINGIIPGEKEILKEASAFLGKIKQIPPMFSAKKVNGKPLYKLARKGIHIEREPVDVEIKELEIVEIKVPYVKIRVLCSKGTYIRQLACDIGDKLGCGAYLTELRRTRSGEFSLKNAVAYSKIKEMDIEGLNESITRV